MLQSRHLIVATHSTAKEAVNVLILYFAFSPISLDFLVILCNVLQYQLID